MTMYINGSLVGMADAVHDKKYQEKLTEQTEQILGDNSSISVDALKKTPVFNKVFKKLDKTGQENLNKLFNLDGDAKNVSEKELKTILTLLDADLQTLESGRNKGQEVFFMDNEFDTKKTSGIYQATEGEIQNVYQNTKTRAEVQAEEMKKLKEAAEKLDELNEMVADFDISKGEDLTNALNTLMENAEVGSQEGLQIFKSAISNLFKGQLEKVDDYRDGGSALYTLKDGTKIYHNNGFMDEEAGFVTITRPDGTVEKYNDNGELVQ